MRSSGESASPVAASTRRCTSSTRRVHVVGRRARARPGRSWRASPRPRPRRRAGPCSPSASMSRPAESPGGVRNTEPAFAPPGWCSRRQRTISSIVGFALARRRRGRPTNSAPVTTSAGPSADRRYPSSSAPTRAGTLGTVAGEVDDASRSTSTSAVSRPWPPAFMRTAPPTLPGMPDEELEAGEPGGGRAPRASTGSGTAAARSYGRHRAARCEVDTLEVTLEDDRDPGEATIGHEQVRAPPDHEHRGAVLAARRRPPARAPTAVRDTHERRRPDRRGGRW